MTDTDTSIRQGLGYLVDSTPLAPTFEQVRGQKAPTTNHRRIKHQLGFVSMAAVVVAGVIVGLVLSSGPSTQAPGHSRLVDPRAGNGGFTVAPSAHLVNGQSVAITVHSLNSHERLMILMCRGVPTNLREAQTQCDLGTAMSAPTDARGNAEFTYKVHRFFSNGHFGQVDCATYASGCSIGLGDYFNLSQGGTTGNVEPVMFASGPANPSSLTSISTSPGAPFTDGEQIELVGRGFPADTPLNVAQCPVNADCSPLFETVQSSSDGTFSISLTIRQSLAVSGESFSCSGVNSCYLLAQTTQQSTVTPTVAPSIPISVDGPP